MATPIQASVDGEVMAPEKAVIGVTDDGLLRGDGAFEAIKLYEGHPFRLGEHLDRLAASAAAIDLEFEAGALRSEIDALLADRTDEAMLRVVITRGGRRILLVERIPQWPERAAIALVRLSPNEILTGVKSISYAANMHATRIAQKRGADEAVYVDRDGTVLEAPTSSVFWVGADGALRTPALETGILDSITRRVVLESVACEEGAYAAAQIAAADAAFLASTTREIQPIASIDGSELPDPDGGAAAVEASAALAAAVERDRATARAE